MRRLGIIAVLLCCAFSRDGDRAMARDGRGRLGRGGITPTVASCASTIHGLPLVVSANEWHVDFNLGDTSTVTTGVGPGAPGSCNQAVRLQAGATTASNMYSGISDTTSPSGNGVGMCAGGTSNISWGFWAKTSTGQTFDFCANDNSHGTQCFTCAPTANTWAWCASQNQLWWIQSNAFSIGNLTFLSGGPQRAALDVQLDGPYCVVGSTISP